jgi:glutaredoxin 3
VPRVPTLPRVLIYLTATCPFCQSAERLLEEKGVRDVEKIRVDLEPERRVEMMKKSGRRTVPQIWIGERHVGGCDDLYALEREGRLDSLLKGSP